MNKHNNMSNSIEQKILKDDSSEKNAEISRYLEQLSEGERKTYEIAKQHLQSSFSIEKSIGFINWKKESCEST